MASRDLPQFIQVQGQVYRLAASEQQVAAINNAISDYLHGRASRWTYRSVLRDWVLALFHARATTANVRQLANRIIEDQTAAWWVSNQWLKLIGIFDAARFPKESVTWEADGIVDTMIRTIQDEASELLPVVWSQARLAEETDVSA